MFRGIISLLIVAFLAGCQNCVCIPSEGLRLGMIGYDSTDIDTIIIRKFEKGSNFTHLTDTSQWDGGNVVFSHNNDTFQMVIFVGDIFLKSKFDYQVFVPAITQTFSITEMNEPQGRGDCRGKIMCGNIIESCKLDGISIALSHETVYLKK